VVSGGFNNTANAVAATIGGGERGAVDDDYDWKAGDTLLAAD
jgi:hypothetical protein